MLAAQGPWPCEYLDLRRRQRLSTEGLGDGGGAKPLRGLLLKNILKNKNPCKLILRVHLLFVYFGRKKLSL